MRTFRGLGILTVALLGPPACGSSASSNKLPALSNRDANANPMFDFFDFAHPDTTVPELAEAQIDPAAFDACLNLFNGPNLTTESGLPRPQ